METKVSVALLFCVPTKQCDMPFAYGNFPSDSKPYRVPRTDQPPRIRVEINEKLFWNKTN